MFLAGVIKGVGMKRVEQKSELKAIIMVMLHTKWGLAIGIEEEEENIFLFLLAQPKFGLQVDKVKFFIAFVIVSEIFQDILVTFVPF